MIASFSLSGIRCSRLPVVVPDISGTSPIGISGVPRAFPPSTWSSILSSRLFWCWCPDWALGMVLLVMGHVSSVLCSTRGLDGEISLPCLPITVWDQVTKSCLYRQNRKNKLDTSFEQELYKVIGNQGSEITCCFSSNCSNALFCSLPRLVVLVFSGVLLLLQDLL